MSPRINTFLQSLFCGVSSFTFDEPRETCPLHNRLAEVVARGYIGSHQPESPTEAPNGAATKGNSL
jgi:hypothetical protein